MDQPVLSLENLSTAAPVLAVEYGIFCHMLYGVLLLIVSPPDAGREQHERIWQTQLQ